MSIIFTLVNVPTLVLQVYDDKLEPFEAERRLASLISVARFVPLEGGNHILLEDELAWDHFFKRSTFFP